MKGIAVVLAIALAVPLLAQKPEKKPELSRTVVMAVTSLAQEIQQVNKDFEAVDAQVRKEQPGWHLSKQLQLEKDEPKKDTPPSTQPK